MLENCCADAEGQAIVLTKVGVHLARVLASDLMYLAWGMLFVVAAEGSLLIMELGWFGLWWRREGPEKATRGG
jgi:hypothetical protein